MMMNVDSRKYTIDPIEGFYEVLDQIWEAVSTEFDVSESFPEIASIMKDVELHDPCMAAETIIRNMLTEITQLVHRYSPWYTAPARAFGLTTYRDILTHRNLWRLAPEALKKWEGFIELLAEEIDRKSGLISAIILLNELDQDHQESDKKVVAVCHCHPPKELLIKTRFLSGNSIVCNRCLQPFTAVVRK